jgi:ariadne-1
MLLPLLSVDLQQRYTHLLHEAMVLASKSMAWCPTPDCGSVIKAESAVSTLGSVECKSCKSQFCFECGIEHAPALCSHMKAFDKKCAADGGNISWFAQNTKECPKCASFIEKAGGCNWIKCGRCTFEFCWLCSRAMKHSEVDAAGGDHKCNVFKEGEEVEVSARKEDQDRLKIADDRRRFAHYHSRYQAHENSLKLEKKLLKRQRGQNIPIQSKDEVPSQLLETQGEALIMLGNARRTLTASYVLGYYQVWEKGTSLKEVFEDLQHLLENRTEALSRSIEESFIPSGHGADTTRLQESRTAIMCNISAVRTNQRNLIASTAATALAYTSP